MSYHHHPDNNIWPANGPTYNRPTYNGPTYSLEILHELKAIRAQNEVMMEKLAKNEG